LVRRLGRVAVFLSHIRAIFPEKPTAKSDEDDQEDDRPINTSGPAPRNGWALVAPYCAFGSLIAMFGCSFITDNTTTGQANSKLFGMLGFSLACLFALLAVVFGFMGFANAHRFPQAKATGHAFTGIVMGVLLLGLYAVAFCGSMLTGGPFQ
jgi:hypothetical protein